MSLSYQAQAHTAQWFGVSRGGHGYGTPAPLFPAKENSGGRCDNGACPGPMVVGGGWQARGGAAGLCGAEGGAGVGGLRLT